MGAVLGGFSTPSGSLLCHIHRALWRGCGLWPTLPQPCLHTQEKSPPSIFKYAFFCLEILLKFSWMLKLPLEGGNFPFLEFPCRTTFHLGM